MTTAGLVFSRARAALPTLGALAAVVLVATIALGVTLGSVQNGIVSGSRDVLAEAAARSAAVRIETHLADDADAQSDAARAMFARALPRGSFDVHQEQRSLPVDLRAADPASLVFAVQPDLTRVADIVSGTWPANGAAIQADAAEALGLAVGDEFSVGTDAENLTLTVAALWRAHDPAAPYWFADPTAGSGRDGDAYGTVVVDDASLRELPTQLFTSWTVTATTGALDDGTIDYMIAALGRLPDTVRGADGVEDVSSTTEGGLAATLDRIRVAGHGSVAIAASAIIIVGLLALVAIVQLGTVLVGSRRRQTELLRARGLSLPQLAALAGIEASLAAVPAAVLGTLVTALAVGAPSPWTLVAIAVGVCLAAAACLVVVVVADGRAGRASVPSSASAVPFLSGGLVVAVAAAIATLRLYSPAGVAGVDFVGAASPALALVAISVLGTALFFPVAAAAARTSARSGRVGSVLAARQLARRAARYLVPALALAIAVSSAVFATGLATTWSTTERAADFVGVGADVVVERDVDDTPGVTRADYAGVDDVAEASSLVLSTAGLGSDTVSFVAVRPDSAASVLGVQGDDAVRALGTTTPDDTGLELPADATGITADVATAGDGTAPTSAFDVGLWAADRDGALSRVSLAPAAAGDAWTAPVPAGVGPWRLLSVEVLRTGKPDPAVSDIAVSRLGDRSGSAAGSGDTVDVDVSASQPRSRVSISPEQETDLAVVITDALAARLGVGVGDPLALDFEPTGTTIPAVVSALAPRLPGTASRLAVGTDLRGLDEMSLRPGSEPALTNAVWIRTNAPGAVADAAARVATTSSDITTAASTSTTPVVAAALTAFWLAATAAALLALVAITAFFVDDFRARRDGIAVLRALGLSTRAQVATRRREMAITAGFAALVGTLGGALATAVVVGPFVASTVPTAAAFVRAAPAFDPLPWLAYCAAVGIAGSGIALALLAGVRRAASSAIVEQGTA